MTPRYKRIMNYWRDNAAHLALEHKVWDPTPYIIDIRSPYPGSSTASFKEGDIDRFTHIEWLNKNIGKESWPIHGIPGDWNFADATVDGETWLGFKTRHMMEKFIKAFPKSVITKSRSYEPLAKCCNRENVDCDSLGIDPLQPCWGKVTREIVDCGGESVPVHTCEGHYGICEDGTYKEETI